MRKVVASFASSVDGYMEGPNGEHDWILLDKDMDFSGQMKRFDTYLYGRVSYEKVIAMNFPSNPDVKKSVFSRSITHVQQGYTLINKNVETQINSLKEQPGKDIALYCSANLSNLIDLQAAEELVVTVIPVLLGKGKPMIDVLDHRVSLSLIGVKTFENGTLQQSYLVNNHYV